MFGIAQWCRLGVGCMGLLPDIRGAQHTKSFGIGGHDAVLDAVVHHLDEMPGPVRPAMQVTLFGGAAQLLASRRTRDVASSWRERREDRVETFDYLRLAADHHAIAALEPPHTAAGPDIDIMDAFSRQLLRAPDVVDVVGIAAVDQDVARLQ